MAEPIRILLIESTANLTGSVRSVGHLIQELRHDCSFAYAGPSNDYLDALGVPHAFEARGWRNKYMRRLGQLLDALSIRTMVRTDFDVVHVNDFHILTGCLLRLVARRTPIVCHVRLLSESLGVRLHWILARVTLSTATAVVAVSNAVAKDLPDSPRVLVIPDGVPISGNASEATGAIARRSASAVRIAHVGHFVRGKGHLDAVRVAAELRDAGLAFRLVFVGETLGLAANREYEAEVRRLVAALRLDDIVEFHASGADVQNVLNTSDLLLNLSERESFSMVCLEGLAAGIPVVTYASGGPNEIFAGDAGGLVVPVGDTRAATTAALRLIEDEELREAVVVRGHARLQRYDVKATAEPMRSLYHAVLSGELRSAPSTARARISQAPKRTKQ